MEGEKTGKRERMQKWTLDESRAFSVSRQEREAARLREAVRMADENLAVLGRGQNGYLFSVQRMVLADTAFSGVARELISREGFRAEEAVCEAAERLQNRLSKMKNGSMRRHTQDVEAVRRRVLGELARQENLRPEIPGTLSVILPASCPGRRASETDHLPPR